MAIFRYLQHQFLRNMQKRLLLLSFLMLAVAVACGGGGDGDDDDATSTSNDSAAPTSTARPGATSTAKPGTTSTPRPGSTATPAPGSTATPQGSATSTSTAPRATAVPTSTPVPSNAVASAGNDLDTKIGNFIGLNGSGSSDPDGDQLTFTWTQTVGPDVTGGAGKFLGPTPGFAVPISVSTLVFELTVSDGSGQSVPDTVQINVFEHVGNPGLFVDGNSGSDDTGDGTRENPYASIGFTINRINGPNQDIHVMSLENGAAYEEEQTLSPPVTASLYGGYGPGWVRDVVNNKTGINGATTAVRFRNADEPAWFSGFDVTGANASTTGASTFALRVDSGGSTFVVEDNILRAGTAGNATSSVDSGSSYGLFVGTVFNVEIRRNEITAGIGGSGTTGGKGGNGAIAQSAGSSGKDGANGGTGGAAGKGGNSSINGGRGGNAGGGLIPQAGSSGSGGGGPAGNGGNGDPVGAGRVGDGSGGGGGAGGNGGSGGEGSGSFGTDGLFKPGNGDNGTAGGNGGGGGGGGGGAGGIGLTGGGGGGGGGGGRGGVGGGHGKAGGASIGILLNAPVSSTIEDNTVTAQFGGLGGNGGAGGTGGAGKAGAVGGTFECSFGNCDIANSGDGGEGGGGGSGGIGGQGGGGAGGPSYGIVLGPNVTIEITDSIVTAGNGGKGGVGGAAGLGGSPGGGGGSTGGSGGCCSFLLQTAGTAGSGGDGGWSFAIYNLGPDNDGLVLRGTQLQAGQPGVGRAIGGKSGQSGETNPKK